MEYCITNHAPRLFRNYEGALNFLPGWVIYTMMFAPGVAGLANLIYKLVRERQSGARRKLRFLLAGFAAGLGPLILLVIASRLLGKTLGDMGQGLMSVAAAMWFFLPATMAYLVVVERALDVGVIIRQGLQYALAARTLQFAQFALVIALILLAWSLGAESGWNRPQRLTAIAACIAAIFLVRRGGEKLGRWVDRRFFREAVDAEHVLHELTEEVHGFVDTRMLLGTVVERVAGAFHVAHAEAYLSDGGAMQPAYAYGSGAWAPELTLPLKARENVLGQLVLGPKQSEEPYSPRDLRLLNSVAVQTGLALENSRLAAVVAEEAAARERMNRELEIARDVQARLFPKAAPTVPGLDLAGYCRPAQTIGGDYYDFLTTPAGEIGLGVGDVAGKGIPAALLMAGLQASLRGLTLAGVSDLGDLMTKLNQLVYDTTPANRFATFFYGLYESASGRLRFVSAGHNPALLLRAAGEVEWLKTGGIGLGLKRASSYREATVVLAPGDRLLLYTDGLTEAMNPAQEEFGMERLLETAAGPALNARDLLQRLLNAVDAFAAGAPQHDDITLITAQRLKA